MPATRKLITISLPPPLLKRAEQLAQEENRTKSELVREALRFYVETRDVRKAVFGKQLLKLLDRTQARASATPPREIRKALRETVRAVREVKTHGR